MTRKPASSSSVSHWKERKSWPTLTKESQQSQARAAERGRNRPKVRRTEAIRPAKAMMWREVLEAPKIQVREGRAHGAPDPRAWEARERRFSAGRMPSVPIKPGNWK